MLVVVVILEIGQCQSTMFFSALRRSEILLADGIFTSRMAGFSSGCISYSMVSLAVLLLVEIRAHILCTMLRDSEANLGFDLTKKSLC